MRSLSLRLLTTFFNIAWWGCVIFVILVFSIIAVQIFSGADFQRDIAVQLKSFDQVPRPTPTSDFVSLKSIPTVEAVLKVNVKRSWAMILFIVVGFGSFSFLLLSLVSQVRKLLRQVRSGYAFTAENARRLKWIAACFAGMAVLKWMDSAVNYFLLKDYFTNAKDLYMNKFEISSAPLLLALSIMVLSEIFRQGEALKSENESFV